MLPKVILHSLVSVDGKMEGFREEAVGLYYGTAGRLGCDTWLVGSDTLLEAEQQPEFRLDPADAAGTRLPDLDASDGVLMVVPDRRGRVRKWFTHVAGTGVRGVVVLVSNTTPESAIERLEKRNIQYIRSGEKRVDYREALTALADNYECRSIQTDSGGVLNSLLIAEGLASELSLVIAPDLVGVSARGLFRTLAIPERTTLELLHVERLDGGSIWLRYQIHRPG